MEDADPILYRSITFTAEGPSTADVLTLLSTAQGLKSLELRYCNDTNAILGCVGNSNPRLETLILIRCRGSPARKPVASASLLGVLNGCKLLQRLEFIVTHCQGREVYNKIGLRLPLLRSVILGKPRRYNSEALYNIANNCKHLEEILAVDYGSRAWENVLNCSITDYIVNYLCNKLKNLKIVELHFNKCSDASMTALATCQNLTTLLLHLAKNITDIGIMAISDMPQLVDLIVRDNSQISTKGWLAFLQRPIMRRLRYLDLTWCDNVNQEVLDMILDNPYDLQALSIMDDEWSYSIYKI